MSNYFKCFKNVKQDDEAFYGTRAVQLSDILKLGIDIPDGYALSSTLLNTCAFKEAAASGLSACSHVKIHCSDELLRIAEVILDRLKGRYVVLKVSWLHDFALYEKVVCSYFYADTDQTIAARVVDFLHTYRRFYNGKYAGFPWGLILETLTDVDFSGMVYLDRQKHIAGTLSPGMIFPVRRWPISERFEIDGKGKILCTSRASNIRIIEDHHAHSVEIRETGDRTIQADEQLDVIHSVAGAFQKLCEAGIRVPVFEWAVKDGNLRFDLSESSPEALASKRKLTFSKLNEDFPLLSCSLIDRYIAPVSTCYLSVLKMWQNTVSKCKSTDRRNSGHRADPMLFYLNRVYWNLDYQKEYTQTACSLADSDRSRRLNFYRQAKAISETWYNALADYCRDMQTVKNLSLLTLEQKKEAAQKILHIIFDQIGNSHFEILGTSQILFELLLKLGNETDNDFKIISALNAAVTENKMTASTNELVQITDKMIADLTLRDRLTNCSPPEIKDYLENSEEGFFDCIKNYIARHGHRGCSNDDLSVPHMNENPLRVISLMKTYGTLLSRDGGKRFPSQNGGVNRPAETGERELVSRLASEYVVLRENQRYYFDMAFSQLRRVLQSIGDDFYREKYIESPEDIFHMTIEEILKACSVQERHRGSSMKNCVAERKQVLNICRIISPPLLIRNGKAVKLQKACLRKSYRVTGTSAGKAEGRIRVVCNPDDLSGLKRGEILVVKNFHPELAPALMLASGIVMSCGNLLSHGSILAREYAVPAVVFNGPATHIFKNGMGIQIDGTLGKIHVYDEIG